MDKPIYTDTYFRIESGYEWGRGMSEEKTEAFFAEIRNLFSQNGFTIEERKYGGCPDVVLDISVYPFLQCCFLDVVILSIARKPTIRFPGVLEIVVRYVWN